MRDLDLGGEWRVNREAHEEELPAAVPGCVHLDLLAAGRLCDLNWRDNEATVHWVCEADWTYRREFEVDDALLAHERVLLRCEGLDTLATVRVNGEAVIEATNMFRSWTADVRPHLRSGGNRIEVAFRSPLPTMKAGEERHHLHAWNVYHEDFAGKSWVRKMPCSFGWDWGPRAPTAGIWRPIRLEGRDATIEDLRVRQHHADGAVRLAVEARCAGGARLRVRLRRDGEDVAAFEVDLVDGAADADLAVPDPQLWWPNGLGAQPLYDLDAELVDEDGEVRDRAARRTGLRTVELVREEDEWGESFAFAVNGVRFFAKGANWIPADIFVPRLAREDYARLLGAAAEAHMNVIRCWGGGIYEQDDFYELCDELGLLVWQDFMFACSTYPADDGAFMAEVRAEAIENVRRLRDHPSLLLWCGNNELEQGLVNWDSEREWSDHQMPAGPYRRLFDELLAEVVEAEDGERPYWPCSPHTPVGDRKFFNDPASGDSHCWDVWFGGWPIEDQRRWTHRFMSEFGFQSFPEPRTVEGFTEPEDRNLTSWVMDFHQRSENRGNKTIFAYVLDWFQVPKNFEEMLWATQLVQALCIQYAAEHGRRIQPRMEGIVYWQINDIWPAATWSSIDVHGRWKALHHFAKRFFAPLAITGVEDLDARRVEVHVSNHGPGGDELRATWRVTDCAGEVQAAGEAPVAVPSQSARQVATVDCGEALERCSRRDLLVWLALEDSDGTIVARNLVHFARPKHLLLRKPRLAAEVVREDGAAVIELSADVPAMWVRVTRRGGDLRLEDNFVHLDAGETRRLRVVEGEVAGTDDLELVSLVDMWS